MFKKFLRGHSNVLSRVFSQQRRNMTTNNNMHLNFDNLALRTLPIDTEKVTYSRNVANACFSLVQPSSVDAPQLVAYSQEALALLDLTEYAEADLAEHFSGNVLLGGSQPAAHCYCGHQFGYFSGQLGDGAAMYLGEVVNKQGQRWEIQLKGAGATPYSRSSDGRKVLRSSIREFLCSEAMHHLGIPTTRAGTCVTSDSKVVRDVFYNGNPQLERCTIVSRIAPTFLRFGSFEIFKPLDSLSQRKGPSVGRNDILVTLLDYTVQTFYPEIWALHSNDKDKAYLEFYKEVVKRTAKMVALWQCVGFCHGVLNTDNMSIMGITIDYGPFGFMDYFDPDYICNASDNNGRYTYKKQPEICKWNLLKLAEAIKNALPLEQSKQALQQIYDTEFSEAYYAQMRSKLGLQSSLEDDVKLIQGLLSTMQETAADFTETFTLLAELSVAEDNNGELADRFSSICMPVEMYKKNKKPNADIQQLKMVMQMARIDPSVLDQLGVTMEILESMVTQHESKVSLGELTEETKRQNDKKAWSEWLVKYRERLNKEMESLSENERESSRRKLMNSVNPRLVLRNHIAQEVIDSATDGDFIPVRELLEALKSPFADSAASDLQKKLACVAPSWASALKVT